MNASKYFCGLMMVAAVCGEVRLAVAEPVRRTPFSSASGVSNASAATPTSGLQMRRFDASALSGQSLGKTGGGATLTQSHPRTVSNAAGNSFQSGAQFSGTAAQNGAAWAAGSSRLNLGSSSGTMMKWQSGQSMNLQPKIPSLPPVTKTDPVWKLDPNLIKKTPLKPLPDLTVEPELKIDPNLITKIPLKPLPELPKKPGPQIDPNLPKLPLKPLPEVDLGGKTKLPILPIDPNLKPADPVLPPHAGDPGGSNGTKLCLGGMPLGAKSWWCTWFVYWFNAYPSYSTSVFYPVLLSNWMLPAPLPPQRVLLSNPAMNGVAVQCVLDGYPVEIQPGYAVRLPADHIWSIQFDRGNGQGLASYSLAAGKHEFELTTLGWELYRQ